MNFEEQQPPEATGGGAASANIHSPEVGAEDVVDSTAPNGEAERFGAIPPDLIERPQWVCWHMEARAADKPAKVPINPVTGRRASATNPATWTDYATAVEALADGRYRGIGYVFTADDPFTGIDLDKCIDRETGQVENWALEIIRSLDSYTEVTQSGAGFHIIVRGKLPPGGRRKGRVEVYDEGRFFAMTGDHWPGTPVTIEDRQQALDALHRRVFTKPQDKPRGNGAAGGPALDDDQALLDKARAAANGSLFKALFDVGDLSGHGGDHSAADLALCAMLAFWTGGDAGRMDRLFRQSALMRAKWGENRGGRTYGQITIDKALEGLREGYSGRPQGDEARRDRQEEAQAEQPEDAPDGGARHNRSTGREQADTADGDQSGEWPDPQPLPPPGGTDNASPYPLEHLPAALRQAAEEVARFGKMPVASPAVIGLAVVALAIGKKAIVEERPGLTHHPALFFALIATTGERKSDAFRNMAHPLEAWIDSKTEDYAALRREAKANNDVVDARIDALRKKARLDKAELWTLQQDIEAMEAKRLEAPPHPRMFTSDATEQRLFQKLEAHGGAYAVLSGEGRPVFDAIMGKYSGDGRTGDAIYLAGISGDTITRDRVGNENGPEERVITRPCLNVCVMIQPDKYLQAAGHPALRASGALARIWPVWLPSTAGTRYEKKGEPGLNPTRLAAYEKVIYDLLNHQRSKGADGRATPHRAVLSAEAAEARRELHNMIEGMMAGDGDLADVKDIASKATTQVAKLALVLHLMETPTALTESQSVVTLDTWAAAQMLGIYHLQEAVRVQRLADEDTVLDGARRVLAWLKRQGLKEVTARAVVQYAPRPRPTAKDADAVLDLLADHGYLRYRNDPARRKPVFDVHPALCSQRSHCSQGGRGK